MTSLSPAELLRYSRHLVLPEVGLAGQARLKAASVLCIGAGGLGSPLLLYLAAAGVGRLGVADFDTVDASNLQRQVLYSSADVGRSKAEAACERLAALNPDIEPVPLPVRVNRDNALELCAAYDIVVDGSDNFATRYLVNDACVLTGRPNVHASVFRFDGQLSVFGAPGGPCYRCLYPEPPPPGLVPGCADGGVLGVLPGIVGSLQALETLKLILGTGEALIGRLLLIDTLSLAVREVRIRRDPACALCGERPTLTGLMDYDEFCGALAPGDGPAAATISVAEYHALQGAGAAPELLDLRQPHERAIASIAGARPMPLDELAQRCGELDPGSRYVLACHFGERSAQAWQLLHAAGFRHVQVLAGGLDAWAAEIDPAMPRY